MKAVVLLIVRCVSKVKEIRDKKASQICCFFIVHVFQQRPKLRVAVTNNVDGFRDFWDAFNWHIERTSNSADFPLGGLRCAETCWIQHDGAAQFGLWPGTQSEL